MDDIRPVRPRQQPTPPPQPARPVVAVPLDHRLDEPPAELRIEEHASSPKTTSWKKWLKRAIIAFIAFILLSLLAGYGWYQYSLRPVSPMNDQKVVITVPSGFGSGQIAGLLKQKGLIRDEIAFRIYMRFQRSNDNLLAGTYRLSPAESTPQIVDHIVSGRVDSFTLTFYPGATLRDMTDKPAEEKVDVTSILKRAGYRDDEIKAALTKHYDHPVLTTKPDGADLEGYVYGETYSFPTDASVEAILTRTFDELYKQMKTHDLEAKFKAQGLTLYQGITMASIVQREVPSSKDQKQVAQVFLKRYREGMPLGSDITAYYGADEIGVARAVTVDTPYNTRIHTGLPPGPIASPGLSALLAVANPATGDYLYFLSGDDEVTYFARTNAEHEANIRAHCAKKCAIE